MSKQTFLNELIANGYQPRDLEDMPTEDLALLVQEEYVANTWSPAARAAARNARKRGKLMQRPQRKEKEEARLMKLARKAKWPNKKIEAIHHSNVKKMTKGMS